MSNLVAVGKSSELAEGSMKQVLAQGREILIAKVGNNYYATDNRCPHMGANLSQGKLESTIVTCPRHSSQFDLSNGRVVRWTNRSGPLSTVGKLIRPPRPIVTYQVRLEGDAILVEI